jgi:hypothetical protein
MTQLMEPVAIGVLAFEGDADEPCWYCSEPLTGDAVNKETADPDATDDEDEDAVPENDSDNNAGILGGNLGDEPEWTIKALHSTVDNPSPVVPAAHHCIPGEASLAKVKTLHKFMRKGGPLKLASDIGYDVNDAANGVWLPGNYAVRPGKFGWRKKWSGFDRKFKDEYASRAVDAARSQFHDAHVSYNTKVRKALEALVDKLGKPKDKCPVCKKELTATRPPYGLVGRLNCISSQHRGMLSPISARTKRYVAAGYYTSSRMKTYYGI